MFWDAQRDSDWFKNHPILSAEEMLATPMCFNQTVSFLYISFVPSDFGIDPGVQFGLLHTAGCVWRRC